MANEKSFRQAYWKQFREIIEMAMYSETTKAKAFKAIIECDCLNLTCLDKSGIELPLREWIEQDGFMGSSYKDFEIRINKYKKHGAKNYDELNPPRECCVIW